MEQNAKLDAVKRGYQVSRVVIGAAMFLVPDATARVFGKEADTLSRTALRFAGSRDAMIGVGQILGERHGSARGWYEAAAVADLLDAGALIAAGATGGLSKGRTLIGAASAVTAGVLGVWLARSTEKQPADDLDAELARLTAQAPIEPRA